MKQELLQFIPKNARVLGVLHDAGFRPDQAPNAQPIEDGRVIFDQDTAGIEKATLIRAPLCLMSEGDTMFIKQMASEEAFLALKKLTLTTPTAAMIFDAFRNIESARSIAWFCEDQLYAENMGRATGINQQKILPLFKDQSDEITNLLTNFASLVSNKRVRVVHKLCFSSPLVKEAIEEKIVETAKTPEFNSRDRRKLKESSAAVVASTHALFTPIVQALIGSEHRFAVQGPVHLETNPSHWPNNLALSTVRRFIKASTQRHPNPHRSLLPCLFEGKPIGEFSAFDEESPQLRRDQKSKLTKWASNKPLPLTNNPIFGHAIGLLENPEIELYLKEILEAEGNCDVELACKTQIILAQKIEQFLTSIDFWK